MAIRWRAAAVRNGSAADVFAHSTLAAAYGGEAAMFSARNPDSKGPQAARTGGLQRQSLRRLVAYATVGLHSDAWYVKPILLQFNRLGKCCRIRDPHFVIHTTTVLTRRESLFNLDLVTQGDARLIEMPVIDASGRDHEGLFLPAANGIA